MDQILMIFYSLPLISIIPHMLAYIDPGIGSIVVQATVAAVAGIAIIARVYWDFLLKFLGIRKKTNPGFTVDEDSAEKPDDQGSEPKL